MANLIAQQKQLNVRTLAESVVAGKLEQFATELLALYVSRMPKREDIKGESDSELARHNDAKAETLQLYNEKSLLPHSS
jgi:hypothetical protein